MKMAKEKRNKYEDGENWQKRGAAALSGERKWHRKSNLISRKNSSRAAAYGIFLSAALAAAWRMFYAHGLCASISKRRASFCSSAATAIAARVLLVLPVRFAR